MSLLGFDALGRLALGQLPSIGLTNTVMTATAGSYMVVGQSAVLNVAPAWTPKAKQPEPWSEPPKQAETWTPAAPQPDPWTS